MYMHTQVRAEIYLFVDTLEQETRDNRSLCRLRFREVHGDYYECKLN